MSTKHCPIQNPNIEEFDLCWDLRDEAACFLESEGIRYRIRIEAFKRLSIFSDPDRKKLADWVLKQHNQGRNVPIITTDTLKSLGLSRE